jgi:hypothetical protein
LRFSSKIELLREVHLHVTLIYPSGYRPERNKIAVSECKCNRTILAWDNRVPLTAAQTIERTKIDSGGISGPGLKAATSTHAVKRV